MALLNWLLPNLFVCVKEIDYVPAMGVLLLSKILFGGHGKWHKHRWESMTPEEREKFQAGMRGGCGASKHEEVAPKER